MCGLNWTPRTSKVQEVVRLREEGLKLKEIAPKVGISESLTSTLLVQATQGTARRGGKEAYQRREAHKEVARDVYEETSSVRQVARTLERSRSYALSVLEEAGVELPVDNTELQAEVLRLFLEEGMTQIEIGQELGITNDWASKLIRRAGFTGEDRGVPGGIAARDEALRKGYEDDRKSLRTLSKEFAMPRSTLRHRLLKMGVKLRAPNRGQKRRKAVDERDREIVRRLADGEKPASLAQEFGITPARISQIKKAGQ